MSTLPLSNLRESLSKAASPSNQPARPQHTSVLVQKGSSLLKRITEEYANTDLAVLSAKKRSAEHALSDLQSEYEEKLSKVRREHQMLSLSNTELVNECSAYKSKYDALEIEHDLTKAQTFGAEADRQARVSEIINTYSTSESQLNKECSQLREEQLSTRQQLVRLEQEKTDLACQVMQLEGKLEARSKHLSEVQAFFEEKQKQLEEVDRFRREAEELAGSNVLLQDRLRLAEQEIEHLRDAGLCSKGPSHLIRLEMEHTRLKTAYKALSKERADWLITHEENEDLRRQVDQLKEWRQRALVAENALLEKETLLSSLVQSPKGEERSPAGGDRPLKPSPGRVRQLQRENQLLLASQGELRETIVNLQSKLRGSSVDTATTSTSLPPRQQSDYPSDAKLILELRHQITVLEGQVDALTTEKLKMAERLEAYDLKGVHDPKETRILTLSANPAAEVKESLYNETVLLRQQHERQRQRIKVLEECLTRLREQNVNNQQERSSNDIGVTRIVDDRVADQPDPLSELAHVREKLRTEVLRGDRLMELFQKATTKFRGACRDLLGYRIDIEPSDEYRVRSVAATHPDEYVRFRRVNGHYELVDSEYTQHLDPSIRSYLEENNSIPGFFASLTLSILQQATMLT